MVFWNTFQKLLLLKSRLKLSRPTHGLPVMPLSSWNSLKASVTPYRGAVLEQQVPEDHRDDHHKMKLMLFYPPQEGTPFFEPVCLN